jgi:predicted nuclease with TOPRIM domain
MTEENTKDLTDSEKLNLILAELADLRQWRAKVDAFIDDRSQDTRPKLDLIIKELSDLREEIRDIVTRLDRIESRFETLATDVVDVRAAQRRLGDRVSLLEQRPS